MPHSVIEIEKKKRFKNFWKQPNQKYLTNLFILCKIFKKICYKEKFNSCKNDIERTWRYINDIFHRILTKLMVSMHPFLTLQVLLMALRCFLQVLVSHFAQNITNNVKTWSSLPFHVSLKVYYVAGL